MESHGNRGSLPDPVLSGCGGFWLGDDTPGMHSIVYRCCKKPQTMKQITAICTSDETAMEAKTYFAFVMLEAS